MVAAEGHAAEQVAPAVCVHVPSSQENVACPVPCPDTLPVWGIVVSVAVALPPLFAEERVARQVFDPEVQD